MTMVTLKEEKLKEDPEFRFRRKPAPKKPVARNAVRISHVSSISLKLMLPWSTSLLLNL